MIDGSLPHPTWAIPQFHSVRCYPSSEGREIVPLKRTIRTERDSVSTDATRSEQGKAKDTNSVHRPSVVSEDLDRSYGREHRAKFTDDGTRVLRERGRVNEEEEEREISSGGTSEAEKSEAER